MGADVFVRRASGLVRTISPLDLLFYSFCNPGILYAFLYLPWTVQLYPDVYMPSAAIAALFLIPIAMLYVLFSVAMPRSGGEYIYTSRSLSPAWGYLTSWTLSIIGMSWSGTCTAWLWWWGINNLFRIQGIYTNDSSLINLAATLDGQIYTVVFGTIILAIIYFIMWRGTKASMWTMWIGVAFGTLGMLALGIAAATSGGPAAFATNWQSMTGTTVNEIIDAAKSTGWSIGAFTAVGTLIGSTYVALNTLGSTYAANIAGEVKEVRRAQMIAQPGSLMLFALYWFVVYGASYAAFGGDFLTSIARLQFAGDPLYANTIGQYGGATFPIMNFMMVYLPINRILPYLATLGFIGATFGSVLGMSFGPVRNMFAWAFDRVIPPFFSRVDRRGSPWAAILLGGIISEIFLILFVFGYLSYIAYSILGWFAAWIIFSIAGIVFPFRRKDIFEKSPSLTKAKAGPVPVITILGIISLVVSAFFVYAMLYPAIPPLGTLSPLYIYVVLIMMGISFVIYYVSYAYHKSKGVQMALQFKEIPPD